MATGNRPRPTRAASSTTVIFNFSYDSSDYPVPAVRWSSSDNAHVERRPVWTLACVFLGVPSDRWALTVFGFRQFKGVEEAALQIAGFELDGAVMHRGENQGLHLANRRRGRKNTHMRIAQVLRFFRLKNRLANIQAASL
jgi:hypothetical protein